MSDDSAPYEIRVFRNLRTNETIVNCGKMNLSATISNIRSSENGQRLLGTKLAPLREFIDWEVTTARTLPPDADSRQRAIATNEVIASIPSGCLTAPNRKVARDVLQGAGQTTVHVYTSSSASLKLAYTGRCTASLNRFVIQLRNRHREVGSPGYELFNAPDLVTRLERSFSDINDADLFLAHCNMRHAEKNMLIGSLRTPMKALRAKNAPSEVVKRLMAGGSADARHEINAVDGDARRAEGEGGPAGVEGATFEPQLKEGIASEAQPKEAGRPEGEGEEKAAPEPQAMDGGPEDESEESGLANADGADGEVPLDPQPDNRVDFTGIYLFRHPTNPDLKYVANTPNLRRYLQLTRQVIRRPGARETALTIILKAQPESYMPEVLEELTNVTRSYANSRVMHFKREFACTAGAQVKQLEYDPKLVAFKHDAKKTIYLHLTREPMKDMIQRMHGRVRAFLNRTDKYVRALPVIMESDHYVEVVATWPKTTSPIVLSRAKESEIRKMRRAGWIVLNVDNPREERRTLYRFYRIFRTVMGDRRCYIGRTTNAVATRIEQHVNEMASKKFSSWEIIHDGRFSFEEIACKEFDTVKEANAYEAALMDRYPDAVNREHQSLRGIMVDLTASAPNGPAEGRASEAEPKEADGAAGAAGAAAGSATKTAEPAGVAGAGVGAGAAAGAAAAAAGNPPARRTRWGPPVATRAAATPAAAAPPTPIPGPTVLMNGRRVSINDIFMD
jgi:hypothetical protein